MKKFPRAALAATFAAATLALSDITGAAQTLPEQTSPPQQDTSTLLAFDKPVYIPSLKICSFKSADPGQGAIDAIVAVEDTVVPYRMPPQEVVLDDGDSVIIFALPPMNFPLAMKKGATLFEYSNVGQLQDPDGSLASTVVNPGADLGAMLETGFLNSRDFALYPQRGTELSKRCSTEKLKATSDPS